MKIRTGAFLIGTLGLFLLACEANTPASPPANPKVLEGLIRMSQPVCKEAYDKKSFAEQKELVDALRTNNMTVVDFCKCIAQTMFGPLSQAELDQWMSDSAKYNEKITEHEPHRTRVLRATSQCLVGVWPGNTAKSRESKNAVSQRSEADQITATFNEVNSIADVDLTKYGIPKITNLDLAWWNLDDDVSQVLPGKETAHQKYRKGAKTVFVWSVNGIPYSVAADIHGDYQTDIAFYSFSQGTFVKVPTLTPVGVPRWLEKQVRPGEQATGRVVLQASGNVWVELRDGRGGKRFFSRLLKKGEIYNVPAHAGIMHATASAGSLDILVDGQKIVPLGPVGGVRLDVLLEPEALLSMKRK